MPIVLDIVCQPIRLNVPETGFQRILARLFLAPHRAEFFASLCQRHGSCLFWMALDPETLRDMEIFAIGIRAERPVDPSGVTELPSMRRMSPPEQEFPEQGNDQGKGII